MKPLLKWAGGKRWLLPILLPYLAEVKHITEPFVGAGSVTFNFNPKQALLSDINPHLINFYKQLQLGLETSIPFINTEESYYSNRQLFNELISIDCNTPECALLFYYLNRTCFNGLCRFNNKGLFNVPYGKYKTINYIEDFSSFKIALENYNFLCCDFEQLIIPKDSILYLDPPYDSTFTKYSKQDFLWKDQVRLANWATKHRGLVVVSNQATDRIVDLYTNLGFDLTILDAPRRISANGNRDTAKEILGVKYSI